MDITVIKKNINGDETWRYHARLVEQKGSQVTLEAIFDRQDMQLHGLLLGKGDRFVETWFTDRWYNIFEIHAREDDAIRGWYCNIGLPAEVAGDTISYVDLCLDLLVFPDGKRLVLDEDEFVALQIPSEMRQHALEALQELQTLFER